MCFLKFSIARIQPKFKKNLHIFIHGSSRVAKNIEGYFKFLFSYLSCNQIWLILLVDHCHFGWSTTYQQKHWLNYEMS
jgi:hypothetical protein